MRYTELQLSSALLDQPFQDSLPTRKLLILAPPRTGSYMLCRLMLHAGLGVPHEYFNEIHIRLIGQRFGLPHANDPATFRTEPGFMLRYLHRLYGVRTRGCLFAAKIQYKQYYLFLRNHVGDALFEGASLVYLTRQDVLAQAVSLHFARLTGRWSFERTRLTKPRQDQEIFDIAAIARAIKEIRSEQTMWERLFTARGVTPLRITYESLCADRSDVLVQVARTCGIAPDTLTNGYDDQGSYETDAELPSKRAVMQHYLQQQAARA